MELAREITGDWLVEHTTMRIELDTERVVVETTLNLRRHPDAPAGADLILDGSGLELISVVRTRPDHEVPATTAYRVDGETLVIEMADAADGIVAGGVEQVTVVTACTPGGPADEGFSVRPLMMSTACEPESFRSIAYTIDRPSQHSTYDVTVIADPVRFPVIRANGDVVGEGAVGDGTGRHWRRFVDPVPKSSYLFAVVAGQLGERSIETVTPGGHAVTLTVLADPARLAGASYVFDLLPKVIAWDEANGGVPHDLAELVLAAIPSYPGGACECHGLMLFETNTLLLDPTGFTDDDLPPVLANVSHEYLHHTRGNRVTVATWRDLALKEGLTVLAQHDVHEHLQGPAARILDVHDLRRLQFPEEITLAAPVVQGPESSPDSLYTRTTYLKGAEIWRMLRSVVGDTTWLAATQEWIRRFDLSASTIEDFLDVVRDEAATAAHAGGSHAHVPAHRHDTEVSGNMGARTGAAVTGAAVDAAIDGVARWFHIVGRPSVRLAVTTVDDAVCVDITRTDSLTDDPPVMIPIALSFSDEAGRAVEVSHDSIQADRHLVLLTTRSAEFRFGVADARRVVTSVLDGYSAPIDLVVERPPAATAAAIVSGRDPAARWLAAEALATRCVDAARAGDDDLATVTSTYVDALERVIAGGVDDPLLLAQLLAVPDEHALGDRDEMIDVDGVAAALDMIRATVGRELAGPLHRILAGIDGDSTDISPSACAARTLADVCLGHLLAARDADAIDRAVAQVQSPNPTSAVRALAQLLHIESPGVEILLDQTYERWRHAPALLDRWTRAQTGARTQRSIERVRSLVASADYQRDRRPSVMAVWFPFCNRNRAVFHHPSGDGYRLLGAEAVQLLQVNPAVVLRLVGDLLQFQRFDPQRQAMMRVELERIGDAPGLPAFVRPLLDQLLAHA